MRLVVISVLVALFVLVVAACAAYKFGFFDFAKPKVVVTTEQQLATAKEKVVQFGNRVGPTPSKETLSKTQTELTQLTKDATSAYAKQVYLNKSFELYVNNDSYEQALVVAIQSEQIKPTALTAANIAYVYMGLKDYPKAVKYYQLAADRSDKVDSPTIECPYNDYIVSKHLAEESIK